MGVSLYAHQKIPTPKARKNIYFRILIIFFFIELIVNLKTECKTNLILCFLKTLFNQKILSFECINHF